MNSLPVIQLMAASDVARISGRSIAGVCTRRRGNSTERRAGTPHRKARDVKK